MIRKVLSFALLLSVTFSAHAQFGGLGGMLGGNRSGGSAPDNASVEKFTLDALIINKAVTSALLQVQAALAKKEDMARIKEVVAKYSTTTDTRELGAVMGSVIKSDMASTLDVMKSQEGQARLAKLSPEMQQKVATSILNVAIASLRIKPMMDNGSNMMQSIGSNPMLLTKLPLIKDSLSLMADSAPKLPELISVGFSMLKTVKIDPGNPTAASKIVEAAVTVPDEG
jgi:hypothetical protein